MPQGFVCKVGKHSTHPCLAGSFWDSNGWMYNTLALVPDKHSAYVSFVIVCCWLLVCWGKHNRWSSWVLSKGAKKTHSLLFYFQGRAQVLQGNKMLPSLLFQYWLTMHYVPDPRARKGCIIHLISPNSFEVCREYSHSTEEAPRAQRRELISQVCMPESGGHTRVCWCPGHPRLLSEVTPAPTRRPQSWLKSEDISQGPDRHSASFESCFKPTAKPHTLQGFLSNKDHLPVALTAGLRKSTGLISFQEHTLCHFFSFSERSKGTFTFE